MQDKSAEQPSTVPPLLDSQAAIQDLGGDLEGYLEVSAVFLDDLQVQMERLDSRSQSTPAAILPVIHEVANSLGVIKALRSEQQVRQLERRMRGAGDISAQAAADITRQALLSAREALLAWLSAHGPQPQP